MTLSLNLQSVLDPKRMFLALVRFLRQVFLSHDSKKSKISERDNPYDLYPKNLIHVFLPKSDFEGYRNTAKKQFE
jgi:hypothetical protein